MNSSAEISLNSAQCIVSKAHLGRDVITNICKGTTQVVEWGVGDWVGGAMIVTLLLLLVVAVACLAALLFAAVTGRL